MALTATNNQRENKSLTRLLISSEKLHSLKAVLPNFNLNIIAYIKISNYFF